MKDRAIVRRHPETEKTQWKRIFENTVLKFDPFLSYLIVSLDRPLQSKTDHQEKLLQILQVHSYICSMVIVTK